MSVLGSVKRIVRRGFSARDRATLERLGSDGDPRTKALADAVLAVYAIKTDPPAAIGRLEAARAARAADTSPLDDGSLGPAGSFDEGVTVADACAVSKPPSQALLLYALTSRLKPSSVLELGTNIGVSAAFLGTGLADGDDDGRILTLDVSPYRLRVAERLHAELGLTSIATRVGLFEDTLDGAIDEAAPIDMAFIDGNHQYEPTLEYTDKILARCVEGAVVVYDDIRWSDGMKRAWADVCRDPRFSVIIDLYTMGIALYSSPPGGHPTVTPALYSVLAP